VSLIVCDNAAVLHETLVHIDLSEIEHQFFSDRAIALPAREMPQIIINLRARGVYPRVVGGVVRISNGDDGDVA
jgi:hypothetical protein